MAKKKTPKKIAPKKAPKKSGKPPAAPPAAVRTVTESVTLFAVPDEFSPKDKDMLRAIYGLFMSVNANAPSSQAMFVSMKKLKQATLDDLEANQVPLAGTC